MRRFSSVLALAAGIAIAILFAKTTHLKEWSWILGLLLGVGVAAVLSRVLYGYAEARRLDSEQADPGSYGSRTIIQNITGAPPDPLLEDERETNERETP